MRYAPWFAEVQLEPVWKSVEEPVMALLTRSAELSPDVGETFAIATKAFGQAAGTDETRLDTMLDGAAFGSVLSNYIHTNNNRLGLRPDQEILVALLLARALEARPAHPAGSTILI